MFVRTLLYVKNKKNDFLFGHFAVCLSPGTRQSGIPRIHSFVVCLKDTRQSNLKFAVCRALGTPQSSSQRRPSPSRLRPCRLMLFIAVCLEKHTANMFVVCLIFSTRRSQLCRRTWSPSECCRRPRTVKFFAVCFRSFAGCPRHTANRQIPVVSAYS